MSKIPATTPIKVEKVLRKMGFIEKRQKGSHCIFEHPETKRQTVLPMHRADIPKGTLKSIIEDTGLSIEEFTKLL